MLHVKKINSGLRSPVPGPASAQVLALQALAHVAGDPDLGPRFLALSGLDVATLRARAGDTEILAAVIEFLCARESDLIACAAALDVKPEALARAGTMLAEGPA